MSDERGAISSKRLIALICTIFLCANEAIHPSPELVSAITQIAMVCIGATAVDKFSQKSPEQAS